MEDNEFAEFEDDESEIPSPPPKVTEETKEAIFWHFNLLKIIISIISAGGAQA